MLSLHTSIPSNIPQTFSSLQRQIKVPNLINSARQGWGMSMSHPRENSSISMNLENKLSSPKIQWCDRHQTAVKCFLISKEEKTNGRRKGVISPKKFQNLNRKTCPVSKAWESPFAFAFAWESPWEAPFAPSLSALCAPGPILFLLAVAYISSAWEFQEPAASSHFLVSTMLV